MYIAGLVTRRGGSARAVHCCSSPQQKSAHRASAAVPTAHVVMECPGTGQRRDLSSELGKLITRGTLPLSNKALLLEVQETTAALQRFLNSRTSRLRMQLMLTLSD